MAALVLLDAEIIAGPLRLTTTSNETSVEFEADELDTTVFGLGGWRRKKSGLKSGDVESSGFWDSTASEVGALSPDAELWGQLGGSVPVIVSPTGEDLGVAYIVPTRRGDISMLGQVGEVAPYSSAMRGNGAAARGGLVHPPSVTRSASGVGSTLILGTVPEGRSVLASIHVLSLSGTSPQISITVERDDNAGFASATTVATLASVTTPSALLTEVEGPITPDDRYRVSWTISGTAPVARFAVAVGIT